MPKDTKVSPSPKRIENVSLLGGGRKGPSAPPRLFPGDLISFRAEKPYEWLPWFGVVLSPNHPMVRYMKAAERKKAATLDSSKRTLTGDKSAITARSAGSSVNADMPSDKILDELVEEFRDPGDEPFIEIPEDGIPDAIYVNWAHSQRIAKLRDRKDIAVVDRNLLKGQRVKNAEGVTGTVVDRTEKVTLQVISTNHVIDNVNAQHLSPVAVFFRGREIQYQGWIGVITAVRRLVTCRLENGGAHFYLKTHETDGFMKPDPYWGIGMPCAGLPTKFAPATMKKAVFAGNFMRFVHRWVRPVSYFYTRSSAKTVGVETTGLDVLWVERCPNCPDAALSEPPPTIEGVAQLVKIRPLGLPNYETLGLNSVRMYGIKAEDALMSYGNWYAGFQNKFFGTPDTSYATLTQAPSTLTSVLANGYQIPVKVIFRQTEVEVDWDNGISEHLLAARIPTILSPLPTSEYETGLVVESKHSGKDQEGKYGVIVCHAEPKNDKVKVRWIEPEEIDQYDDMVDDTGTVHESVLDLKVHPTVSTYSRGTTVFLKDHPKGYLAGTITGLDLRSGKLLVAVPEVVEPIPVHAHKIIPLSKRTYWNFAERKWIQEPVTLPSGRVSKAGIEETKVTGDQAGKPVEKAETENLIEFEKEVATKKLDDKIPVEAETNLGKSVEESELEQFREIEAALESMSQDGAKAGQEEKARDNIPAQINVGSKIVDEIATVPQIDAENEAKIESISEIVANNAENEVLEESEFVGEVLAGNEGDAEIIVVNEGNKEASEPTGETVSTTEKVGNVQIEEIQEFNLLGDFQEPEISAEVTSEEPSEESTPKSTPSDSTITSEQVQANDEGGTIAQEGQVINVD